MIHQYGFCQCQIIDTQSWRHHRIHKRFAFSEGNNRAGGRRTMLDFLGDLRIQALVLHQCCFVIILNDMKVHVFVAYSLVVLWRDKSAAWWMLVVESFDWWPMERLCHWVWTDLICVDWRGSSALEEPRHPNAQKDIKVFQNASWNRYFKSVGLYCTAVFDNNSSVHHERGGLFCSRAIWS